MLQPAIWSVACALQLLFYIELVHSIGWAGAVFDSNLFCLRSTEVPEVLNGSVHKARASHLQAFGHFTAAVKAVLY